MNNTFSIKTVDCRLQIRGSIAAPTLTVLHLFRGALGRVLGESASESALRGAACTFDPPSAYDVMHNSQGSLGGRPLPKPFVLRYDEERGDTVLTMRLFGRACAWRHVMLHGMVAAARRGLDLNGTRQSLKVSDAHLADVAPARAIPSGETEIILTTPLILRSKRIDAIQSGEPVPAETVLEPLFDGLALRYAGLAAWHDQKMAVGPQEITPTCIADSDLRAKRIKRGPGRSRIGITGRLRLERLTNAQRHSLAIAEQIHVGADSTIGAGRLAVRFSPNI
jgi:hypothetical protein